GIHDLTVHQYHLYLAYGDANINLGSVIPVGLRHFSSDDDPGATNEFDTDEEQIDRYRSLGGDLFAAGPDATEDGWLGNIYYRRDQGPWVKSRTLDGGVHVHDVEAFGGAHWAVGSGAQPEEWNAGDIYAHLWRSGDGGESFEIVERVHNGGDGDARWIRLLPVGGELYLFGYTSNAQYQTDNIIGATHDGTNLTMLADGHPLRWVFALETDPITDELGILRGVDVSQSTLLHAAYRVTPTGVSQVDGLIGKTVVDLSVHEPTGEILLLTHEGDDYQASFALTEWQLSVVVTTDFETFTELLSFTSDVPPSSIAFWRDRLYYGTDHGQVWRAEPLQGR
ncbi:MAG: hypothetical protein JRI68_27805, partial [Deltaproteobacteria bacterium]|nr:hypothetical protein [Deltaproteobacteria bacterium]